MTKTALANLRATAAKDLGLKEEKNQMAHLLMVVRVAKQLHEESEGDWNKVFQGLREVGHGFGMNASQCNQWLDKVEKDGAVEVMADLEV